MKKTLAATAALIAAAGTAQAQSSVELYGLIDVGVGQIDHQKNASAYTSSTINPISPNADTNSLTGMFNGPMSASRWGIRGSEDLGGGLKAIFNAESPFSAISGVTNDSLKAQISGGTNATNSSLNGQLFGRAAWVGLESSTMGKLTVGRNPTLMADMVGAYDPLYAAALFSPFGWSGTWGGGGGVSENARLDNSVKYSHKIGSINFGAIYKFGNQAGSTSAQSAYGFIGGYEEGPIGIQLAYSAGDDAIKTGAGTGGAAKATVNDTEAWFIATRYKVSNDLTLKAGYENYKLKAPSVTYTTATLPSVYGYAVSSVATDAPRTVTIAYGGGDYNISQQVNIAVGYWQVSKGALQGATSKAGAATDTFTSILADYRFSKRTNTYAGLIMGSYGGTGDAASQNAGNNSSNKLFAVGLRHRF